MIRRSGGFSAQSLAQAGASVVELQTAGRWQSPSMPGRYARGPLAAGRSPRRREVSLSARRRVEMTDKADRIEALREKEPRDRQLARSAQHKMSAARSPSKWRRPTRAPSSGGVGRLLFTPNWPAASYRYPPAPCLKNKLDRALVKASVTFLGAGQHDEGRICR